MKFKHKNVLVYGVSVSGEWVAKLLKKLKANVFLFDDNSEILKNKIIKDCYVLNELNENLLSQFDFLVVSYVSFFWTMLLFMIQAISIKKSAD